MIATYAWKLNPDTIYKDTEGKNILGIIEKYEMPRTIHTLGDFKKLSNAFPTENSIDLAQQYFNQGRVNFQAQEWHKAYIDFENWLTLVERFRATPIISEVNKVLYLAAYCTICFGSPIGALVLLKQSFLIGDVSDDCFDLYENAKKEDEKRIDELVSEYKLHGISGENSKFLTGYLLYHPLPKRVELAREIIDQCLKKNSTDKIALSALARCHMADGNHEAALEVVENIDPDDAEINELRNKWYQFLGKQEIQTNYIFQSPNDDLTNIDDIVNRGFTLLVNAIYLEALVNFLKALQLSNRDPFALFGYALVLWRLGNFGLAKHAIADAIEALANYPKQFRFLTFSRSDETCAPKSIGYNPIYPIYNMEHCQELINNYEPFVSYILIP